MLNLTDVSYHGHAAGYFIMRPVAEASTFKKGVVAIERTDKQLVIPRLELDNFIQPYSPTPTDNSTITVDAVTIQLVQWNLYTQFNPLDFKEHWFAPTMQETMLNAPLPSAASQALLQHMMDKNNLFIDQLIWRGDTRFDTRNISPLNPTTVGLPASDGRITQSSLSQFDGIIKQLTNDAGTIDVANPWTLTATNSVAALQAVYNSIPTAMVGQYGPKGLRFLFSTNTLKLIEQNYNIVSEFKNFNYGSSINNLFLQYEMVPISGMPDNTIVATFANDDPRSSQFIFAVNSEKDQSNLEMAKLSPASDLWFIKGIIKAAVGTVFADQVVMYTTLNY